MKRKVLYLDVETTGLNSKINGIHQIAFIVEIDGEIQEMVSLEFRPFEGCHYDLGAMKYVTWKPEDLQTRIHEEQAFEIIIGTLRKYINAAIYGDDFTMVAYNGQFDVGFMQALFERNGKKYSNYINYRLVDPLAFLRILHIEGKSNLSSYKLSAVYEAIFGFPFADAHDALADIVATREVYQYLIQEYLK
ncbi:MAG: 3'-5' exonuclease [Ignisphaera sp.]|nr:3'-5' exonuclease [Ignisphaera sp.]